MMKVITAAAIFSLLTPGSLGIRVYDMNITYVKINVEWLYMLEPSPAIAGLHSYRLQ